MENGGNLSEARHDSQKHTLLVMNSCDNKLIVVDMLGLNPIYPRISRASGFAKHVIGSLVRGLLVCCL